MLSPLPLPLYSTYSLLRTSKICIFRKVFSDKKTLQDRCLPFYLFAPRYILEICFLPENLCVTSLTQKQQDRVPLEIDFIVTIYKINPGKQSFKLLWVQLNDGSTRSFYISMSQCQQEGRHKRIKASDTCSTHMPKKVWVLQQTEILVRHHFALLIGAFKDSSLYRKRYVISWQTSPWSKC